MTTTQQPKALELADYIDPFIRKAAPDHLTSKVVADELRRQHAEIDSLRAEVERERKSRRAAQIENESLKAEIARLEPIRQLAKVTKGGQHALMADVRRGRFLLKLMEQHGILVKMFCRPMASLAEADEWWLLFPPYGVDRSGAPLGFAKTQEGAIDAAREPRTVR